MSITGIKMRTAAPSGDWRSFLTTAPSGGVVGGNMNKIQDTVGVYMKSEAAGSDVAFIYHAEKILLPKKTGTGESFSKGAKVYYDPSAKNVSPNSGSGRLWIGIATEDANTAATTVEVDFKGDKAT